MLDRLKMLTTHKFKWHVCCKNSCQRNWRTQRWKTDTLTTSLTAQKQSSYRSKEIKDSSCTVFRLHNCIEQYGFGKTVGINDVIMWDSAARTGNVNKSSNFIATYSGRMTA